MAKDNGGNPLSPQNVVDTATALLVERIKSWLQVEPNPEQWGQSSRQPVDDEIRLLVKKLKTDLNQET